MGGCQPLELLLVAAWSLSWGGRHRVQYARCQQHLEVAALSMQQAAAGAAAAPAASTYLAAPTAAARTAVLHAHVSSVWGCSFRWAAGGRRTWPQQPSALLGSAHSICSCHFGNEAGTAAAAAAALARALRWEQ